MDFNSDGVIQPGFHELSIKEVHSSFVENFPNSQSRRNIFKSFLSFIEKISIGYAPTEIWIDGSFVTSKVNPNDIDILLFFTINDYLTIYGEWNNIRVHDNVDAYFSLTICEDTKNKTNSSEYQNFINNRNYWRGQFGFDRNDIPKGIIKVSWERLKEYLNGGDFTCL